jgi:outer membrane protein assembly factor BamB
MSATASTVSARIPGGAPSPARHRFWIPLSVIILVACAVSVPWVLEELDKVPPNLQDIAAMVEMIGVPSAMGLIFLWWLFLSGFSWRARLGVLLLLALAAGGFVFSLSERPVLVLYRSYYLVPTFRFKWQKSPAALLAEHNAAETKGDLPAIDLTVKPSDFPRYRGRDGDGVAHGRQLALDWSAARPRVLYRRPCLYGYSGFAVAGNVAITMEQRSDQEVVVCYDRATGRERWTSDPLGRWNDPTNMGDGPRTTPAIDGRGKVFAIGATGILVCLDGLTGKDEWRIDTMQDSASKPVRWGLSGSPLLVDNFAWGLSGSPLLVDNLVVVNPGVDPDKPAGRAVCAYDRKTGKRIWAEGNLQAAYSSPRLATLCGTRQIVLFDGDGLAGIDPANGKELWRYPWTTEYGMNTIQPLVFGDDLVFISSELRNGCAMVRVAKGNDGWSAEEAWKNKDVRFWAKFSNPVLVGEAIFGLSAGDLYCLSAKTGELFWKERGRGRFGAGQLLAAGDRLIVQSDDGRIYLVAAETTAYKEMGSFEVLDRKWDEPKPKTWNTPALAGTQLFLRDNEREMACVELPAR